MFWQFWTQTKASCRAIQTFRAMESTSVAEIMPRLHALTTYHAVHIVCMKHLGAADLWATDGSKICFHILQYELQ